MAQSYPLIGFFGARGCVRSDPGDGDVWDSLAAPLAPSPAQLVLQPFDQHAHPTDAMTGWSVGSDGARAQFSGAGVGAAWVVCVDARRVEPSHRALLSLLLVVEDAAAHDAVRAVAAGVGDAGAAPRDVLARLAAAVPALAPLVEGGAAAPF